ncbi:MAG: hypothetical protein ACP5QB_05150 [Thiomonas sp.]
MTPRVLRPSTSAPSAASVGTQGLAVHIGHRVDDEVEAPGADVAVQALRYRPPAERD